MIVAGDEDGGREGLEVVEGNGAGWGPKSVADVDPGKVLVLDDWSPESLVGCNAYRINLKALRMILLIDREEHFYIEEFLLRVRRLVIAFMITE